MKRTGPDWSTLPEGVLAIIAKRLFLHSLDDLLRFRAVCHSFRSSSACFYPPKTLIPRSSFRIHFSVDSTPGNGSNFMLSKSTIYTIQPLHKISDTQENASTWLVRIEESNFGKVRITDPIDGFRFKKLFNEVSPSLNLLDYRVKEIATAYRLQLATLGKRSRVYKNEMYNTVPKFFRKVIVSECVDAFAVMAIHSDTGKLVVWRNGDMRWTNIDTTVDCFRDIVYHNEKFYALGSTGVTIALDYKSLSITQVANPMQNMDSRPRSLVKSLTDLLLISQFGFLLKVYKLDEEKREWVPVMHELVDRVLFLGNDCAFSLSANQLPGCEANCVYYSINTLICYNSRVDDNDFPGRRTWFCNLKNRTSDRFVSNNFWPPPTWIKQDSRLTPILSQKHSPRC